MNKIVPMLLLSLAGASSSTAVGAADGVAAPGTSDAAETAAHHPGKAVYDKWCGICHGRGERMPGTASLQVKYQGAIPAALEDRSDMTPEFVAFYVRNGVMIMPAFRKTEVTDADLGVLVEYLSRKQEP